ncbi:MAG: hypothetical protein ACLRT4_08935 [Thomasclavelia sp.]
MNNSKTEKRTTVDVDVNVSGIDEAVKKTEHLVELLKEVKSLADDLASNNIPEIRIDNKVIIPHFQENLDKRFLGGEKYGTRNDFRRGMFKKIK